MTLSFIGSNLINEVFNSVSLSGSNGIASNIYQNFGIGIYYTIDSGQTWTLSNITTGNFTVYLSDLNGIACSGFNTGLYYTTNAGQTWIQSNLNTDNFYSVFLSGSNGIVCNGSGLGLFYSTDSGQTWTQSNVNLNSFYSVFLSGSNGIAGSANGEGIYYTTDAGQTWTQSTLTDGVTPIISNFNSVALSGLNGIAGSISGSGLYYTTNAGQTWEQSNITTDSYNSPALIGSNGIAGSLTGSGIYYTINAGQTWIQSNITTDNFLSLALSSSGLKGLAGSYNSNVGLYTTSNGGITWTQTNITSGNFNSVSMDPISDRAIAGGVGIYYSSGPICYEKNTLILIIENDIEVYKKVCELKVGDIVKTYKHVNKKIKIIKSFKYNFINVGSIKNCLFKMRNHDIIVTGRHGILIDKLTDEEKEEIKRIQTKIRYIDDKLVLPACASDKFERISNNQEYELWHFALENNDVNANYGVYINDGILSESCSEAVINNQ